MPTRTPLAAYLFILFLPAVQIVALGQEERTESASVTNPSLPVFALSSLQDSHSEESPLLVLQKEIDDLILTNGGGACPIAAGIIAVQGLRSMAGLPFDKHPHRTAIRAFQEMPKLKEGRISNIRFVEFLKSLCDKLNGTPVAISVASAPTSTYDDPGRIWTTAEGPDISVLPGQIRILAYTVTDENKNTLGRHFVLLKKHDGKTISVVNPKSPLKDYTFALDYCANADGPKHRLYFRNPPEHNAFKWTLELNTIFTVRIIGDTPELNEQDTRSVNHIKAEIDDLAKILRDHNDFTNPVAWRKQGAAFGLPGLDLPTEIGGSQWKTVDMLEIFRHAGRHNLNLRDVIGAAHGRPLARVDSAYAKKVLREIVSGNAYVAIAVTEPDAGSDMRAMQSRATQDGRDFLLTGNKLWNARLRQATHVIIYTLAANGERGSRTAFLLPTNHPGLRIEDEFAHGLSGNSFGGVSFDNMRVAAEHVLGEDGDGERIFREHFIYWRLMQSAAAIGCGEAALDQMAKRIKVRQAYGGPIGRFTHLQQPLGEHTTKLRMAFSLAREAASLIDQGQHDNASALVNGIKAEGVEVALAAADAAMRAHGALGYSRKVDLGDRVRDLMGLRIADGTTDVMRMEVVRSTYGFEFWKMAIHSYTEDTPDATAPEEGVPSAPVETH